MNNIISPSTVPIIQLNNDVIILKIELKNILKSDKKLVIRSHLFLNFKSKHKKKSNFLTIFFIYHVFLVYEP